ncbi:MAG: D-cysteine desulfhydrase family protein [Pseudomonadales bacterium]
MNQTYSIPQLNELPRVDLCHTPTPLQHLKRLSEELGGPRIWVKRDDCTGLATGGNKTRKLEYLLGDALANDAQQVVTFGAVQSNHARQTAAACARLGLPCHLLLTRQVPSNEARYESGGNMLLNALFGATVTLFDPDQQAEMQDHLKRLKAAARTYVIPAGGSNATGALGYAQAAAELATQCAAQAVDLKQIVLASSSSGTQAGLVAGMQQLGIEVSITGVNVYHKDPQTLIDAVTHLVNDVQERFSLKQRSQLEVAVNHAYLGEGYGQLNDQTREAIELTARLEGLLFDPVYSGKALTALIDQIAVGSYHGLQDIVLIHTGGVQALNVYESAFHS